MLHMEITGEKQGKIEGSCTMQGREGTILIRNLRQSTSIPFTMSGVDTEGQSLASGKRNHQPIVIHKEIDKSSPKLYMALTSGENIPEVILKWFRISKQGTEEHYFTVKLEDALIVSMYSAGLGGSGLSDSEEVSFAYKKIIWTWEVDGISAEDDWTVPE